MTLLAFAQDANNPEQVKKLYADALAQLKAAQDRKNELATQNEQLTAKVAELQKQLDQARGDMRDLRRQDAETAETSCYLRSHPAAWQTFVGRGVNTQSYVPVAASLFVTARGWLDEAPNDPAYVDFAQITGIESDGKDFDEILGVIDNARKTGAWVVLAGHDMGTGGSQTTRLAMLEKLCAYATDPANGVWIAPVGTIARYVRDARAKR